MASVVNQDDTGQRGEDRNHSGAVRPDGGTVRIDSATGTDNPLYPLAFSIRRTVFGGEQQVPVEHNLDGLDPVCRHYVLFVDDEPTAELRVEPHKSAEGPERFGDTTDPEESVGAGDSRCFGADMDRTGSAGDFDTSPASDGSSPPLVLRLPPVR